MFGWQKKTEKEIREEQILFNKYGNSPLKEKLFRLLLSFASFVSLYWFSENYRKFCILLKNESLSIFTKKGLRKIKT